MDVADHNHLPSPAVSAPMPCANCGAALSGRYCSACGQKAGTAAHSVGHFLWEAIEALTHADSRVRSTLPPLLLRPGFLTREFFAGRRTRYVQPLRLYLILSVTFFVLSALLNSTPNSIGMSAERPAVAADCGRLQTDLHWRGEALLPRLKAACLHVVANNGLPFGEAMVRNLGRAMFVFLPLLAALMKLLYWRPRHYYMEHLVLLIHNHACVFLLMSVLMLATHWFEGGWMALLVVTLTLYLLRYLYRSMKVMYGQSGLLTFLKFDVLLIAYLLCGSIMVVATALVSADLL
jgi:hypothetical protein